MANIQQIERGLARWLDAELVPQLPQEGWKKVIVATAISLMIKRSGAMINSLLMNPVVSALGIVDEAGDVDIDIVATELKKNVPDTGMKLHLPMIGELVLRKNDVDSLYAYIKEA